MGNDQHWSVRTGYLTRQVIASLDVPDGTNGHNASGHDHSVCQLAAAALESLVSLDASGPLAVIVGRFIQDQKDRTTTPPNGRACAAVEKIRRRVMRVGCPYCAVAKGQECRTASGKVYGESHTARYRYSDAVRKDEQYQAVVAWEQVAVDALSAGEEPPPRPDWIEDVTLSMWDRPQARPPAV